MIIEKEDVFKILGGVMDPEVPVLSVLDLGIVREVQLENGRVIVTITPTYSGCPAMDMIRRNIESSLKQHGFPDVQIRSSLSPAWTTDWMSETGKEKLKAFGIAPPNPTQQSCEKDRFHKLEAVQCPHCNSFHTERVSEFGSTACKAIWRCLDCLEPFDYFKCH